jgi:glutamine amidotransferase
MRKISVLNYGCGNLLSIGRSIKQVGYDVEIIENKEEIEKAEFLVLPGVGAFNNAMGLLKKKNLIETVKNYTLVRKKPILGICLGMQLFFSNSKEMGDHEGLNFISGEVVAMKSLSKMKDIKSPQINWNELKVHKDLGKIINKELNNRSFYFVHSYMANLKDNKNLIAYCNYYDLSVPAIVQSDNVFGCQFHPEKSGKNGLKLLENILKNL